METSKVKYHVKQGEISYLMWKAREHTPPHTPLFYRIHMKPSLTQKLNPATRLKGGFALVFWTASYSYLVEILD